MVRPAVSGWWGAIAVSALLYGLIAKSAGATIAASSVRSVFSKLGVQGNGTDAVLGACFLILAVLVAFLGAGQLIAARSEESDGRLDPVLVRPVSRASWLAGRLVLAVAVLLGSGIIAGLFAWLGAASEDAGVSFTTLLTAGLNLVPPAVAILGVGALTLGILPRMTSIVVYAWLGWSLLIVIVGGIGAVSHWILDTSVFHQMASAPAVSPHWEANGIMVAIGVAAAVLGGVAFRRRDLQGE
jgi:ABC-2 type transport system permease protein